MNAQPTPARRWPKRLAIAIAAVVVLAIGIPFAYIHFIEGSAPAKLSLTPATTSAGGAGATSADASGGASSSLDGTWSVGSGSIVGYRVSETLVGQKNTAVGRTSSVTGTLALSGDEVKSASFTAQMATVKSDQSQRDNQFDGRIMDVSKYPTATFTLTSPIQLGAVPAIGVVRSYTAQGDLTLHGQTHPVSFSISAERSGSQLEVQGDINVVFATWGISNPSFGSFVTTANNGTLEFLLHLAPGAAAPSSATTTPTTQAQTGGPGAGPGSGPGGNFGGPGSGEGPPAGEGPPPGGGAGGAGGGIQVPATTTPPLSIGG